MKTEIKLVTPQEKCFAILFDDYKKELNFLGIPTQKFDTKTLVEWFETHLNNLTKNTERGQLCRGKK